MEHTIPLPNGKAASGMPLVGLGTWTVTKEDDAARAVHAALLAGYQLIDTAAAYGNEHVIGRTMQEVFKETGLKRDKVFLTSKVPPKDMASAQSVRRCVQQSLERLQTTYIDLYLIHWPGTG